MPWYWSDDLAKVLHTSGRIGSQTAESLNVAPVAFRRDSDNVEDVAQELAEEGEIPLAA